MSTRWKNDNVQDDRPPKAGAPIVTAPNVMVRKPRLYLAYGSNLNVRDMRYRCPGAKTKGKVIWLQDARLVFRGVADVEIIPGHLCPAGLWLITPEDERTLDRYEGVGSGMYAKEEVDLGGGKSALIYLMASRGIYPPSEYYYNVLKRGYRDFKIPVKHLDAALEHSFEGKDPCEQTIARRKRQRNSSNQRRLVQIPEAVKLRRLQLRLQLDGAVDALPSPQETSEYGSTG